MSIEVVYDFGRANSKLTLCAESIIPCIFDTSNVVFFDKSLFTDRERSSLLKLLSIVIIKAFQLKDKEEYLRL